MDPNDNEDMVHSPKSDVDYSKLSEAEREAQFRRKRQQYVAEKMSRKKQLMKMKRQQFGQSSSDDSDDNDGGSRSSGSSAIKSEQVEKQPQKPVLQVEVPSNRLEVEPNKNLPQQFTPTKKKSESLQRVNVNVLAKNGSWNKDILVIGEKTIIIQNLTEEIKKFSKIKIIAEQVLGNPYKIKITLDDQELIFSVIGNEDKQGLPINYYIFAKLTQMKITESGHKLKENVQQKIPGVPESLISGSLIYGKIFKKSQVLGNWQQRFILVNKEGIFSYKKFNQKHSMFIPSGSINQMWTRFEIQDGLLIVKIWHSSKKTQFGFPLTDLLAIGSWMYCFYCMMGKAK